MDKDKELERTDFDTAAEYIEYIKERTRQTWVLQSDGRWGLTNVHTGVISGYQDPFPDGGRPEDPETIMVYCHPEEPGGTIVCHGG